MKEKTKTLQQLAELVDGEVQGDPGLLISGVGDIHNALPGEITFIVKKSMTPLLNETRAAAVIAPLDAVVEGLPALLVRDPYLATTIIQNDLCRRPFAGAGVSKAAHIGNDCILPNEVSIGPMVVLGERVSLGERVDLKPGVVIGDDVVIG
ncbi:MAG: UDP-3-O-(3-hydroxymyristoyl)glucosamine N-acyltransferase, partial [Desulfobulbaceae bacterium]|nr:UDP-3-O-(3-hydroxymyristoyl)glucosamine N-acyltransferase [Desulfobulbaceae bacterium]